jgi:hypothetical protein
MAQSRGMIETDMFQQVSLSSDLLSLWVGFVISFWWSVMVLDFVFFNRFSIEFVNFYLELVLGMRSFITCTLPQV